MNIIRRNEVLLNMECNHKLLRNDKWMNLIESDWFSMFLEYLNLYDIVQIDNSFCNHNDRPIWLNLLRNIRPIVIVNDLNLQGITDWLVLKDVHPSEITIYGENDVTPDALLRLSQVSSKLKSLKCYMNNVGNPICSTLFQCLGDYNPLLEILELCVNCECESTTDVEQFKESLKHFFAVCHQLRFLTLRLNKLPTQANDVCIQICSTLFQCLGDYNPLLEKLELCVFCKRESITMDVEEFKKALKHFLAGCPLLRSLTLKLSELPTQANDVCIQICSTFFQCLGNHNPLLEKLELHVSFKSRSTTLLSKADVELFNEPLKHFLVGCPLLCSLILELNELPSQCITTIANYALSLEILTIRGNLLEQGSIITKEANKLKKLSFLDLSSNFNLDDESLTNLVTGCNQLECIDMWNCDKTTNISLYSIAENCPNLKKIWLPVVGSATVEVLLALVNKCPKLTKIENTWLVKLPKVIQQELNKRLNILTV